MVVVNSIQKKTVFWGSPKTLINNLFCHITYRLPRSGWVSHDNAKCECCTSHVANEVSPDLLLVKSLHNKNIKRSRLPTLGFSFDGCRSSWRFFSLLWCSWPCGIFPARNESRCTSASLLITGWLDEVESLFSHSLLNCSNLFKLVRNLGALMWLYSDLQSFVQFYTGVVEIFLLRSHCADCLAPPKRKQKTRKKIRNRQPQDWREIIDYRCEDGFPVSASCVTIPNHDLLSTLKQDLNQV